MRVLTDILSTPEADVIGSARRLFDSAHYDDALAEIRELRSRPLSLSEEFAAVQLQSCVESEKGLFWKSLQTLNVAGSFIDQLPPAERAKFYGQRALLHSKLKNGDSALIDLEAAKFWAQESGDKETEARVRNNLSKQYADAGRLDEAMVEADSAIEFALYHDDPVLLGRFYDQKAQILIDAQRFTEAIQLSGKAISLLTAHPSLTEARETHGRALIGQGIEYLEQPDPVATFSAKRSAAAMISTTLDKVLVQLALERCGGRVTNAAMLLGAHHKALLKVIKKHDLPYEQRRRARSIVKNKS